MQPEPTDLTSMHVHRAMDGDDQSSGWLIERLSPALYMQARFRLRGAVASYCEPEDLVQDVWAIALPRLPELVARDDRMTPVLVKFLSTTLLNRVNKMLENYLRGHRPHREASLAAGDRDNTNKLDPAIRSQHGVSAAVGRSEIQRSVRDAIDKLGTADRDVIVLRGIEQLSNNKVAEILGVQPSASTMRYQKALERMRAHLPGSVFAELPDDSTG
jgi:RNA polymerase sigma-70 factor, ECF subfamily